MIRLMGITFLIMGIIELITGFVIDVTILKWYSLFPLSVAFLVFWYEKKIIKFIDGDKK